MNDLTRQNEVINENLVRNAKDKLEQGELEKAKELFEESLEICLEQNWEQGVNYANKTIAEIDARLNPYNELSKAGILQPIGMPHSRKIKNVGVMVNLGTVDVPFMVTDIENELMKKFESETGKNAFWRNKITNNYLKWKENYATGFGEL